MIQCVSFGTLLQSYADDADNSCPESRGVFTTNTNSILLQKLQNKIFYLLYFFLFDTFLVNYSCKSVMQIKYYYKLLLLLLLTNELKQKKKKEIKKIEILNLRNLLRNCLGN